MIGNNKIIMEKKLKILQAEKWTRPVFTVLVFFICFSIMIPRLKAQSRPVIIGYVGGFRGLVNTDLIAAKKLTHINYAFVDIRNNRAWLHREATDTINFRKL